MWCMEQWSTQGFNILVLEVVRSSRCSEVGFSTVCCYFFLCDAVLCPDSCRFPSLSH